MKLKMLETFQQVGTTAAHVEEGITVTILEEGEVYEVDAKLGDFLLEHRKAEKAEAAPHYGAQKEPELRHDDELFKQMVAADVTKAGGSVTVVTEEPIADVPAAEPEPLMSTKRQPAGKTKRRKK